MESKEILVGLQKAYWAEMTSDGEGAATYNAPERLQELRSVSVKPDAQSASADGDDRTVRPVNLVNGADIDLEFTRQGSLERARLLGNSVWDDGTVVSGGGGSAPFGAFGFVRTLTNKNYRFVWILKMTFKETDEDAETRKKGSINLQYPKISGASVLREADDNWRITRDSDTDISAQWFSKQTLETLDNVTKTIYGKPSEVIFCTTLPTTGQKAGEVYVQTGGSAVIAHYWNGSSFVEISRNTPVA